MPDINPYNVAKIRIQDIAAKLSADANLSKTLSFYISELHSNERYCYKPIGVQIRVNNTNHKFKFGKNYSLNYFQIARKLQQDIAVYKLQEETRLAKQRSIEEAKSSVPISLIDRVNQLFNWQAKFYYTGHGKFKVKYNNYTSSRGTRSTCTEVSIFKQELTLNAIDKICTIQEQAIINIESVYAQDI